MFLVVGESVVDLIGEPGSWRFEANVGGSPLNVARGLAAAGQPVRLASEVGDDLFGELTREELAVAGVSTEDLAGGPATNLAFARLDPAGVASYDFRFAWEWGARPDLTGVSCLHTGSLAALIDPGANTVAGTVAAARQNEVPVCYDPNIRASLIQDPTAARDRVARLVATADIVKVSAEDLTTLYAGTRAESVAARWAASGPWLLVVTDGEAGAQAWYAGAVIEATPPTVPVVDTVGAGDAFTAGLLASLAEAGALRGPKPAAGRAVVEAALRRATATAAAICARRGAAPPDAAQVAALEAAVTVRDGGDPPRTDDSMAS
ncbi:carbohydrate kinase [Natronosporangium hydrolyticum]|uniref:Carbohydrate kinase n=1 Tax=Natronosporangium hydrolyticum TaxID=2811111 RepID=A0A895Y601_9ACTN|nr:carbohydrate kinase [Natronosporangium hydrolyticum]QSB13167.1 carbohydrate kinase [Natronosporangium hydrolyticum]